MWRTITLSPTRLPSRSRHRNFRLTVIRGFHSSRFRRGSSISVLWVLWQERAIQEARERQARRSAGGKQAARRRGASRIEIQGAKRQAERTTGRLDQLHEDRIEQARSELEQAREAVREEATARVDLSGSAVPSQKRMPVQMPTASARGSTSASVTVPGCGRIRVST